MFKLKRGELTTQQIVTIVIILVSFSVILFFIVSLGFNEARTKKEICHNSVILKGQSVLSGNLDCKTSRVCIAYKDKCDNYNSDYTVDLDLLNKNNLSSAIIQEMEDCWWMFGEGKVDYVDRSTIATTHCAICSEIKFSSEVQNLQLSYNELYSYMQRERVSKSQTYLNYFYKVTSVVDFQANSDKNMLSLSATNQNYFSLGETHVILTSANAEVSNQDIFKGPFFVKNSDIPDAIECEAFDITKAT